MHLESWEVVKVRDASEWTACQWVGRAEIFLRAEISKNASCCGGCVDLRAIQRDREWGALWMLCCGRGLGVLGLVAAGTG